MPAESYDGPGSSILKRMAKRASAEGVVSFSEADGRCRSRRAIVDGRFKYIYAPDRATDRLLLQSPLFVDGVCSRHPPCLDVPREELFDLQADPFEEANLLKGPLGRTETAALEHLRGQMAAHSNLTPAYRHRLTVGPPQDQIDAATKESLRALGYIQ